MCAARGARRPRTLPFVLDHVEVGSTDADGVDPDEHLAAPRLVELDLRDLEQPSWFVEDGRSRLHDYPSACVTDAQSVTVATFWSA